MPYEIVMVDPELAKQTNVCIGRGITDNSDYLVDEYIERWKTYPLKPNDEIHLNGDLVGGFITICDSLVRVTFGVTPRDNGFIVRRVSNVHPTDTVMQKFGPYEDDSCFGFTDDLLVAWLRDRWANFYDKEGNGQNWLLRIRAIQPVRSERYHGKISIFQTRKDSDNDRQVAMKAGRAFKYILPELDDSEIALLGDQFRERFSLRRYTLKTGREADNFVHAYSHNQSEMDNPRTTCTRKASAHSCMRYKFERLPVHPVSIYASGDFEIIWLEDSNGLIAGRCVIRVADGDSRPQAGPIYGVCEHSMDQIHSHLDSINAVGYEDGASWVGAKLNKVEYENGFIGPYLDLMPQQLEDDGDHLVIDRDGEISASDYQGVLGSRHYTNCTECGGSLDEDEYYYSEWTDEHYCECCYNNTHTYCDAANEMVHNDELVEVWLVNGSGNYVTDNVSEYARDTNYVYCTDGEWWHDSDAIYCESEGEHISPKDYESDYFMSDWNNEVYPNSVKCTLEDGLDVSDSEIVDDDNTWEKNAQGVWIIVEEDDE